MIQIDTWENCYDLGWQNILCPAAFSHPAKYSRGLITRIVKHALEEGWIQPGQTVLDPFSGVACGAWPCLQYGLNYVGVELESKFVELGRENINLWNDRYAAHFPNWGSAQIIQGDSRRLAEVVSETGLVVSSPPYADSFTKSSDDAPGSGGRKNGQGTSYGGAIPARAYGSTPGQLATLPPGDISALIASPPFAGNSGGRGDASRNGPSTRSGGPIDPALFDRHSGGMKGGTGSDPANLDHLPMGQPPTAIVSSPPYASARPESNGGGVDLTKQWETYRASGGGQSLEAFTATQLKHSQGYGSANGQLGAMVIGSPPFADSVGSDDPDKRGGLFRDEKRRNDTNLTGTYGETEGQLGGMKGGDVAAVMQSPPYEKQVPQQDKSFQAPHDSTGYLRADYGSTDGQIGATRGQTFWEAAALIVQQCALLLPPGAAAIFVTKRYVKNGKIVDFTAQWIQLCESCGFELKHHHRALLVKHQGVEQAGLEGGATSKQVKRVSFFRRLHEKKRPDLVIDWEDVTCFVRK